MINFFNNSRVKEMPVLTDVPAVVATAESSCSVVILETSDNPSSSSTLNDPGTAFRIISFAKSSYSSSFN